MGAVQSRAVTGKPRKPVLDAAAYVPGRSPDTTPGAPGPNPAIKLSANERDVPPSGAALRAAMEAARSANRYPDNRSEHLRRALARTMGVELDNVAVGCGSSGLLQQIVQAFVEPGVSVVYPWRSFELYPILVGLAGGTPVTVPLVANGFDPGAIADAVDDRTSLVLLANPNNPTGTLLEKPELEALIGALPEDVIVVVDAAYHEYTGQGDEMLVRLVEDHDNVIVTRTFSKARGLAGMRVGWALASDELIGYLHTTQLPFTVNSMAQAAAEATLADTDTLARHVAECVSERGRVAAALVARGWEIVDSRANFVWLPTSEASEVAAGLETRGVMVRPFPGEGIRVTIGSPPENDAFLDAMAQLRPVPTPED